MIGTNGDGVRDDVERNVISGNQFGIVISDTGTTANSVAGNYIGTNASGTAALGNVQDGVALVSGSHLNRIGTDGNGVADAAERNVISGNAVHDVFLANPGTDENTIAGNYIGTDVSGGAPMGNGYRGVFIAFGARHNTVGRCDCGARQHDSL